MTKLFEFKGKIYASTYRPRGRFHQICVVNSLSQLFDLGLDMVIDMTWEELQKMFSGEQMKVVAYQSQSGALYLPHHGDPKEDTALITLDAHNKAIADRDAEITAANERTDAAVEDYNNALSRIEQLEKALTPFAFKLCTFDFSRWDEETKIEVHLPRSTPRKAIPTVWFNVEHVLSARAALADQGAQT